MRLKMSPILQQNNNNNYPCLSATGPAPLPHKCSLPLPFSSRPELSLTGLPLIRGLRAWALCSKSRHRPGGALGQAPLSHPQPADVHLSAEWGLPLGLDARRSGIGALVATLQTSEGSSRTQTQCLFLRTDRGSCLYPTGKPTLHTTLQHPGGMLRGWLRSKTGGTPTMPAHTGPNRARERSGRRWRKPANHTASRERVHFRQHQQNESRGRVAREEPREELGKESKHQSKDQARDLPKEEPREEHREEPQEETRDQLDVWSREETKEKKKVEHRKETKDPPSDETRDQPRKELREEQREGQGKKNTESRDQPRGETGEETKEETSYQPTDVSQDLPIKVFQMESKHQEHLLLKITHEAGSRVSAPMEELQSCSCKSREQVSADAPHISDGTEAWDSDLMCRLCGPSFPGCVFPSPPAGGGNCKANTEEADPLTTSLSTLGDTAQRSPGELRSSNQKDRTGHSSEPQKEHPSLDSQGEHLILDSQGEDLSLDSQGEHPSLDSQGEDFSLDSQGEHPSLDSQGEDFSLDSQGEHPSLDSQGEHPSLDSQGEDFSLDSQGEHPSLDSQGEHPSLDSQGEDPSLDSQREQPLEDQEFGGFIQAPSVLSHECISPPWSGSGLGGTDSSWDEVDTGSWAVFPQNSTEHREDEGGQWWPLSSGEDRGPTPGASHSPVCVFTAAFPLPPAWSTADSPDSRVPTLTQLLRGHVGPEEGSPERGLLDPFHDLNKMIVQRYKQVSRVSQELLQRSLSLASPNTEVGGSPGNWHISPGHTSSKSRFL
ncbi:uncharacterized protein LOC129407239 [Boleophthalmus pectinirostris]|uniref:uncharacterized protein LOC129407239 n=1 Tax=Boleophthalmus pectinirostris TaxID=150288 RepID=UPI00242FC4E9|nr:uncharacterized protein LOC129407239 [Boleophthalmus pectinirostris]